MASEFAYVKKYTIEDKSYEKVWKKIGIFGRVSSHTMVTIK